MGPSRRPYDRIKYKNKKQRKTINWKSNLFGRFRNKQVAVLFVDVTARLPGQETELFTARIARGVRHPSESMRHQHFLQS